MSFFSTSLFEEIKVELFRHRFSFVLSWQSNACHVGKSVLPMPIGPFGTKEEVLLKVPKHGLNKIGIGMDKFSLVVGYIPSSSTFWSNAFLSRKTRHTKSCRFL